LTTTLRDKIVKLHRKGELSDEFLKLYAVSGPAPEQDEFENMSLRERDDFWRSRVEDNLGHDWKEILGPMKSFFIRTQQHRPKPNWFLEGF